MIKNLAKGLINNAKEVVKDMDISKIIRYVKKHEHPHHVDNKLPFSTRVYCQECEWSGTVEESLALDPSNDACPSCGNSVLGYEI